MDNFEALVALTEQVTREIDLGDYAEKYRGTKLRVWVNPPGLFESANAGRGRTVKQERDPEGQLRSEVIYEPETSTEEYTRYRRAVAIFFQMKEESVRRIDDPLMLWLYGQGWDKFNEYHAELKNSTGGSAPISAT